MWENIFICIYVYILLDFPGGSGGKASVYNAGDPGYETGRQQQPQTTINASRVEFRTKLMKDVGHFRKKYIYCPSSQSQFMYL